MWISWFCADANKHDIFEYMLDMSSDYELQILNFRFWISDSELQNVGCLVNIFSGMRVDIFASKLTRLTCFTLHLWRLGRRLWTQPLGCTTWGKAKGLNLFPTYKFTFIATYFTGNMATYKFAHESCIVCMCSFCSNND